MDNKTGYKKKVKEEKESEKKDQDRFAKISPKSNLGTYVKTKKLLNYIQLAGNYALGVANPI